MFFGLFEVLSVGDNLLIYYKILYFLTIAAAEWKIFEKKAYCYIK